MRGRRLISPFQWALNGGASLHKHRGRVQTIWGAFTF